MKFAGPTASIFLVLTAVAFGQAVLRPAVPLDPIEAIVDAFKTHSIVALGDGYAHGDEQAAAWRLRLLRDPRFSTVINDLVVEGASARYQGVMDRYIAGDDVPYDSLRHAWEDSTQVQIWGVAPGDVPEPYRTVRAVNASLPAARRLRVLLADPPIEWENVRSAADHRRWIEMRDSYPAELIQREVLAKKRRALVVFGGRHLQRKEELANFDTSIPLVQPLVGLIETTNPGVVFSILNSAAITEVQPDAASWPIPSLTILRGTTAGAADITAFSRSGNTRFTVVDGKLMPIPSDAWRKLSAAEQFDAIMYAGPVSSITLANPSAAFCSETAYIQTLLARMKMIGFPPPEQDRLKQFCGIQ